MKQPSKKRNKAILWVLLGLLGLIVIGGAFAVVRYYPKLRQERLVQKARELLERKDLDGAALTARRAMQINDRDPEVVRLMVQITEKARSPALLEWKQRLVDLEPKSLENRLSLAETALKLRKPSVAEETLVPVPDLGKGNARYHELNGKAAFALKNIPKAEAEFVEALKLEPGSDEYKLNLGAAQLQSADSKTRAAARASLEQLVSDKKLSDRVSRVLIEDAVKRGDGRRALALGDALQKAPDATFADRMSYLDMLYSINRDAFPSFLSRMQTLALKDPEYLYALISWLNDHNSALVAIDWCKGLPTEVTSAMPVPIALAQSYAKIGDWVGIKPFIFGPSGEAAESTTEPKSEEGAQTPALWGDREFLRLAFIAAVQRSQGDLKQSKVQWNAAVKAASDRPFAVATLARYAVAWGWDAESSEMLWKVGQGTSDQMWALKLLYEKYQTAQSAVNLLQVATRIHEVEPANRDMANNVAFLSMLLEANVPEALKIAAELHKAEPQHPDYLSTYCFSLHQQGQTQAAVDLMKTLGPEKLKEPGFAVYYALFLAASGANQEAATYFEFAKDAKLLPEEKKLLARVRGQAAPPR